MVVGATTLFVASLAGIISLFFLKAWEVRRGSVLFPAVRESADVFARKCKAIAVRGDRQLARLPSLVALLSRFAVVRVALSFSRLASSAAVHADRLADLVSYKHRFERRETRSDFLRRMSEGKKGVAAPLDSVTEK